MINKQKVIQKVLVELNRKIALVTNELIQIQEALTDATKNAVGDKHETERVMIQLEQERLTNQLTPLATMKEFVLSLPHTDNAPTLGVIPGSLIQTSSGTFYLAVSIGKIKVDEDEVFCLSQESPMGQLLIGKHIGETITLNGKSFAIQDLI